MVSTWFITNPKFQRTSKICTKGVMSNMMASGITRMFRSAKGAIRKFRPLFARTSFANLVPNGFGYAILNPLAHSDGVVGRLRDGPGIFGNTDRMGSEADQSFGAHRK